jgi:2-keto-4-pentenoate hydratase/2-oxohepta-3-ene-1,7-dioic acid hydratase in catechol pathway
MKRRLAVFVWLAVLSSVPVRSQVRSDTLVRFMDEQGHPAFGVVSAGMVYGCPSEDLYRSDRPWIGEGRGLPLSTVRLLPPVMPSKIVCFGWTYPAHANEVGGEPGRKEPLVFLKPPTVLVGNGDTVVVPWCLTQRVEFEGELAIVIRRRMKDVSPQEALDGILGLTIFNDFTARDLTKTDPEYTRGKGIDTFGPIGPWIVRSIDPSDLRIQTLVNGATKQDARTSDMTFQIPFLISYISKVMTLLPGDVIATGTPGGSGPVGPGDRVEVRIERIGTLHSLVR